MVFDTRRIAIDRPVLEALVQRFHGGTELMVDLWNEESPDQARNRKTYYKWLNHGVPMTPAGYSLFRFLDLDPVALVDHRKLDLENQFSLIRTALMLTGQAYQGIKALLEPIMPNVEWPNDTEIRKRFGRTWTRQFFSHDARSETNEMARVSLIPSGPEFRPEYPRAWYIAYRPGDGRDRLWRPYGIMVRRDGVNAMLSSRGLLEEDHRFANLSRLEFGTEFGPSPVDFCVASLHAFDIAVEYPATRPCPLRFLP